eukprot:GSChrysophyteH1.ASY1.ANO1.3276.1 assembled CDS
MITFFYLGSLFLLLLSSIFVLISKNPVHSVLFLILCFCNSAIILFVLNTEFLGLIFIIVYVGAIAILFLFVVMMLNVKVLSSENFNLFIPLLYSGAGILMFKDVLASNIGVTFTHYVDSLNNIDVLGQSLYNYYLSCFLLAGLILLVAMIGAIILTLNFSSQRKNEMPLRQLSRSDNFLTFFR